MKKNRKILAKRILAIFQKGFHADAGIRQYIDSMLGSISTRALERLLADDADCDRAPLIDLIVSPNVATQKDLEPLLMKNLFGPEDVTSIAAFFPPTLETSLYLPGLNVDIPFTASKAAVERFLQQLHITRTIDSRVQAALEDRLGSREEVMAARVMMRNARSAMNENQVPVFVRFVKSYSVQDRSQWMAAMAIMLLVLGRQRSDESAMDTLSREKQWRIRQVRATEQLEQSMARKNMETLMLQGSRGRLAADKDTLFREIGMIDRIALSVFEEMPRSAGAGVDTPENEAGPWAPFSFENPEPE